MARFNVRFVLCIVLLTVGIWIESSAAEPAQNVGLNVEDEYDDKHLHDILPMATEAVRIPGHFWNGSNAMTLLSKMFTLTVIVVNLLKYHYIHL